MELQNNANEEEIRSIKKLISEKKIRLNELKRDGFFSQNSFSRSQKYGSLEARRRRSEIRLLTSRLEEISNGLH